MARKTPEPVAHPAIGPQPLDPRRHAFIFPDYPSWRNRPGDLTDRDIITTDLNSIDVDRPGEDIQKLTFPENSFAVILCNHVLEHVPDDRLALQSCARVLKRGGTAIFTIPGDFSHEATWKFQRPDSNGHFRHYGMDIADTMRACFDKVVIIDMSMRVDQRFMVRKNDMAFVCNKNNID